jgi:hypothetical protein
MRPSGWQVGYPHSAAVVQVILSPGKLFLLLNEAYHFHALGNETVLTFYAFRNVCILLKINIHDF